MYYDRSGRSLAVNAGSGTVSWLRVAGQELTDRQVVDSGGDFPSSVAVNGDLAYVMNAGGAGSVQGFRMTAEGLKPLPGSHRSLGPDNDQVPLFSSSPGQVAFTPDGRALVVTTKGANSVEVFPMRRDGRPAHRPVVNHSAGEVPFAVTFDKAGRMLVAEAAKSTVSTYEVRADGRLKVVRQPLANGQDTLCSAVTPLEYAMTTKKPPSAVLVLSWMPVAAMSVVAVVDVVAGPGVGFLPLVSLGPAFAGLVGGWRRTAVIGVVALLLCVGLGLYDGLFDERRGYTAMASVCGVTGVGIAAAVMRSRREAELASVRSIAEVAQRVLLRPVPLTAGPLQAVVSYTSAVAEARIGGDLYEVVASPHGIRLIVGDVQGKGLAAVETAAVVLGAFREAAHDEPDLVGLGERLERSVARELEGEKFVTAILADIGADHEAVFLNYGHPAPMLVRRDGGTDFPQPPAHALPLGLGAHGSEGPKPYRVSFEPGEQLLLYTDGVTEARDETGRFYPLDERAHLLKDPDAHRALEALREDLVQHADGPPHDDAAMLLLRYHGHGQGNPAPTG